MSAESSSDWILAGKWRATWLILLMAVAAGPSKVLGGETPGQVRVRDFFNVVSPDGADPWILKHPDGWYYVTVSTGSDVKLRRSRTITGIGGGDRKVIYQPPEGVKELWAPEIHQIGGKWYVYVAADDGNNANHRMIVLENPSADPFEGQFRFKGKIADPTTDRWAIDATVLRVGERFYFVWSGWEGTTDVAQDLYIAPMRNPWTLDGPRVLISRPTLEWEKRGGPPTINEGPQILIKGNQVHIVYSASGSWSDHYCLGLLSAPIDGDLLSSATWTKHDRPIFESANGVFGPGHCSFTRSPDDKEDWLVYHSARRSGSGWKRLVRAQPFSWNPDGSPNFGAPSLPNRPIALPSGEPARLRIEAESARLAGLAKVIRHPGCSDGSKVGYLDSAESSATFQASVDKPGAYLMVVRFGNGSAGEAQATHRLTVNDGAPQVVEYENSGWDNWSNTFVHVELKAGANRLKFAKGEGFAEIDCIDLVPQP